MVVDDIVVCGAEPLFMTDYIACGQVVPERIAAIVAGIAEGCALAGCALVGGETAEHPGLLGPDDYDVAGAATGMVRADAVLGPDRVRAGDVVIAMASSGLHSNGYSLARHVLLTRQPALAGLDRRPRRSRSARCCSPRPGSTPGTAWRWPRRSRSTRSRTSPAAGWRANLARVLPAGLRAEIDRTTWTPAPIFELIADRGGVAPEEMERTFNLGVGMVAVVPAGRCRRSRCWPTVAYQPGSVARSSQAAELAIAGL